MHVYSVCKKNEVQINHEPLLHYLYSSTLKITVGTNGVQNGESNPVLNVYVNLKKE
jgi:hypothetical protein